MKLCKIMMLGMSLCVGISLSAQEEGTKTYTPKSGDKAIGITINPKALSSASKTAEPGDFLGSTIMGWGNDASTPEEMFFLRQEPMAAIRMKFMTGSHSAFRVSVGFNGGIINYREYVVDDAALFFNPLSEDVVTDRIRANYANGNIALGMEFSCGNRLRFFGGFSLVYAYGGGKMKFSYGNEITDLNPAPTTMKKIDGTGGINDFAATVQMDYARPVEQYTSGISHGIGLSGDLGVEFFFIPKVSIDARVSMMPIMLAFQPQTYVVYEGLNKFTNKIEDYNRLVSPGSNYLLYGTENYGISFGVNYYF